jgi:hypothetical protein
MKPFTRGGGGASGSAATLLVAEGRDFSRHQLGSATTSVHCIKFFFFMLKQMVRTATAVL